MDELRSAVRDLATAPSAGGADVLVQRLAAAAPSAEVAAFITETLELSALHQVNDSTGTTVRWRLIDRLLGMGFPHALNVTPEDLDYHRERTGPTAQVPAALTMIVSLLSMFWSFGLALLGGLSFGGHRSWDQTLVLVMLTLLGGHGLAAFVSALRVSKGEQAPLLKPLGWSFLAGIALIIGFGVFDVRGGVVVASVLGSPALLTALLCAVTAASIGSGPPKPVITAAEPPSAEQAPEAAAEQARARA